MSLIFWKEWAKPARVTYLAGLGLLGAALGWLAWAGYWGLENVVRWEVLQELVGLPATLYTVSDGLLDLPLRGQVQTVMGQFIASPMRVYPAVATATVAGMGVALAFVLAGSCRLPALRYRLATGLFILLLALCRLEVLGLPGAGRWPFLGVAALLGGVSYYFHAFRAGVGFAGRTGVFLALLGTLAGGAWLASPLTHPGLMFLSYALPGLVLLSMAFIAFVALEIGVGLVWLTSTSRANSRPLGIVNYLFISFLYLLNLLLIWLQNSKIIDWNVVVVSPFLVVGVSILLGIWGVRRLLQQQGAFSFQEAGAGLYVGLATLTTLTMAYAFATANDPLIEVFEDAIVYTHFGMGVAFVLYTVLNFWPIYQQQLPVHRVIYKARVAGLPLFRLAGLVAVVGMVGAGRYLTVRQGYAATLSALGDAYIAENQAYVAQTYYQQSLTEVFRQHKANYALASMALAQNDQTNAALYFSRALLKNPSPQAFAGLSDTYRQTNLFFESIKTLQRGISTFPQSGELLTNLGYLYGKTALADSAYYYGQRAAANARQDAVPLANLLALYARRPALLRADTTLLTQLSPRPNDPAFAANALALHHLAPQDTLAPPPPAWLAGNVPDGAGLDAGQFAGLYNYALLAPRPAPALLTRLQRAALNPANQDVADDLTLALAMAQYRAKLPIEAFDGLSQLATNNPRRAANYRTLLGLLQLEQQLPRQAAATLAPNADTLSIFYHALALTKAGNLPAARPLWAAAARQDTALRGIEQVLFDQKKLSTDLERAFYVCYRPDDANRGQVWESILDVNLKTVAGAALIDTYLASRQFFYAQMILSQLGNPAKLTPVARSLENLAAVKIAAYRGKPAATDSLARAFFVPTHRAEVAALRGRAYAAANQPGPAQTAYEQALTLAPANGTLVAEASAFLRTRKRTALAYEAVRRALPHNETNPALLKMYITLCLDQRLLDYAEAGMVQLEVTDVPADYQAFAQAYQQNVSAIENARKSFAP